MILQVSSNVGDFVILWIDWISAGGQEEPDAWLQVVSKVP